MANAVAFPRFLGGGDLIYFWVGRGGAAPDTLTLFNKKKIADFPTLFKTISISIIAIFLDLQPYSVTRPDFSDLGCSSWHVIKQSR